MKESTWKKLMTGIIFVLLVCIVSATRYYQDSNAGKLTGEEYLKAQAQYMAEFEVYSNNLDNVVTLYLNKSIGEEDFLTHLAVMKEELSLMYANYQSDKQTHPVKTGSHTYSTKKGCESVEECYGILSNILSMLETNSGNKEEMSYKYVAFHQDIIGALADYITAMELSGKGGETNE